MDIIFEVIGKTLIVQLYGELDHNVAEQARNRIDTALDNYKTENLIFDFANVSFMDSSGIGMILGRYRKMGEEEGHMAISGGSKTIRNILNMAGVFSVIDYYNSKEEAVQVLKGREVS